ncbi:carboxylate--amine ligase, partial [Streptomyces sp. NPDC002044]
SAWRAGRSGLDGPLLHPRTMRETSPAGAVEALYAHVREALTDHGDDERVREGVARLLEHGNGARVQRELLRTEGDLAAVVTRCARLTTPPAG